MLMRDHRVKRAGAIDRGGGQRLIFEKRGTEDFFITKLENQDFTFQKTTIFEKVIYFGSSDSGVFTGV